MKTKKFKCNKKKNEEIKNCKLRQIMSEIDWKKQKTKQNGFLNGVNHLKLIRIYLLQRLSLWFLIFRSEFKII